jgi:hypothetical protein
VISPLKIADSHGIMIPKLDEFTQDIVPAPRSVS